MPKLILKNKLLIFVFLIFIVILSSVFLLIKYENSQLANKIISLENKGYTIKSNLQEIKYKENFNFEAYNQKFNSEYKFVITDSNFIKPVVTLIEKSKSSILYTSIYKLERSYFDVYVVEKIQVQIRNKSFNEAIEIVKKYDLSKENPDPANITVQTPPTKEEAQQTKDKENMENEKANNKEYQAEVKKCFLIKEDEIKNKYSITNLDTGRYEFDEKFVKEISAIYEERKVCENTVNAKYGYKLEDSN